MGVWCRGGGGEGYSEKALPPPLRVPKAASKHLTGMLSRYFENPFVGFPPIRENREHFENFFQSGKSGKNRGILAKIREKNFKSGKFNNSEYIDKK